MRKKSLNPYKPTERDKYILKYEYDKFIQICESLYPSYVLLWKICYNAGLRISEALALKTSDFIWRENKINVVTLKQKDHPMIALVIPENLINEIKQYIINNKIKKDDKLFNFTRQWAWKIFKRVCEKANLNPRYSPHSTRHGHGMMIADITGGDIVKVRDRLRHTTTKNTEWYVHTSEEAQKKIAKDIEEYLKK